MSAKPERPDGYRLSSQQSDVHLSNVHGIAPTIVVLVEGPVEQVHREGLHHALECMGEQHEILRMRYREIAGLRYPLQYVVPTLSPAWTMLEASASDEALMQAARSCIDPHAGPVVGGALAGPVNGRLRWALAASSYSLDASTIQELALACLSACTGKRGDASEPNESLQYLDYIAWQADLLASDLGGDGARFWEAQAAMASTPLQLPFEGELSGQALRPAELALSVAANEAVSQLAERLKLPAESILLALWCGFLSRFTQTGVMSFDWHCDIRAEELRDVMGRFVTKLPVCVRPILESGVDALVQSVADSLQVAASWQECFDAAAFTDGLARDGKTRPRVEFAYVRLRKLPNGWVCRRVDQSVTNARLLCECIDAGGSYHLRWHSQTVEDIDIYMHQFATLLEGLSQRPDVPWSQLPVLGVAERERILNACQSQRGARENAPTRLHELFERQAQHHPHSSAIVCGEERLTYRELDVRANRIARRLQAHGAGPDVTVGVYLDRSVHAIAAMLGAMKAGGAYVPLDPAYPPDRIHGMVADADVSALVVRGCDRSRFEASKLDLICIDESDEVERDAATAATVAPSNLAYIIYTSGSTGRPKGVMVSHANAVASTLARFDFYPEPVSRFLLLSSFSFDSSVAGIFWTLGQGGTLHVPPDDTYKDPARIAALIAREKISHVLTLPSFYKQILDSLEDGSHLRCAIVAGEACHADVVEKHRSRVPKACLVNEYGPTEGTVWSNAFRVEAAPHTAHVPTRVPIGRPIPSMRGYVLDERLELCAIGMAGEWYIGGDGIARGYRGQRALTAQRFVADPFGCGERLYRTGDRVRLRPDGEIEYLGRLDGQVKLRGFRIELSEIEQVLLRHQRVREAVAIVHEDADLGQQLLAYVAADATEAQGDGAALCDTLELHLRRLLPDFMVPSRIITVPRLPLMPNGKVDRQALLALGAQRRRAQYVAPTSEFERTLVETWQAVLKVERVGLEDNFFDLGGHSLLMVKLATRIRDALDIDMSLGAVFDFPTVRGLAAYLQKQGARTRPGEQAVSATQPRAPWVHVNRRPATSDRVALYCFPGIFVNPAEYEPIWSVLEGERELHGFVCHTLSESRWESKSLEAWVSGYVRYIQETAGDRPVALLGWSVGGDLAFEAAHQLRGQTDVRFVGLLDVCYPSSVLMHTEVSNQGIADSEETWRAWTRESTMEAHWRALLARIDAEERALAAAYVRGQHDRLPADGPSINSEEYRMWAAINYSGMMRRYQWRRCDVSTYVWMADGTLALPQARIRDWSDLSEVRHTRIVEDSDHRTLLRQPTLANELRDLLRRIDAGA